MTVIQTDKGEQVENERFSISFSRETGSLDRYALHGTSAGWDQGYSSGSNDEVLASGDLRDLNGLQLWRAPTDNDKGFGKWLARDWREAGLPNLARTVDNFEVHVQANGEVRVVTTVISGDTNGGMHLKTTWIIRGDGSVDMDSTFLPFGQLPLLLRGSA